MTAQDDVAELAAAHGALVRHPNLFVRYSRLALQVTGASTALIASNMADDPAGDTSLHCVISEMAPAADADADADTATASPAFATLAARIASSRAPVGYPSLEDAFAEAPDPPELQFGGAEIRSAAGVAIRLTGGPAVGTLVVLDTTEREWQESQLRALDDLGEALRAKFELVQLSSRLEEDRNAEQQRRLAAVRLKGLSLNLGTATSERSVVGTVLERVLDLHLGDIAVMALVDHDAESVRFEHGATMPHDVVEDWPTAPLHSELPLTVATRTGVPIVLGHPTEIEQWDQFAPVARRLHLGSFAAYPLTTDDGDILGSLGVGRFADPAGTDSLATEAAVDDAALRQVAEITAVALHRVARSNVEREHARILQKALLPAHQPVTPGLETAWACYPAGDDVHVGGDWYDVLPFDDRVCLVVGDVAGHDLRAARTMARARHSLAAYLFSGDDGPTALARCGRVLAAVTPPAFATCCVIELADNGLATISSAGHLPSLLIRAGNAATIPSPPGPPMGTFDASIEATTLQLEPGDLLMMYTDGIVEEKAEPLDVSIERLVEMLDGFAGSPAKLTKLLGSRARRSPDDASVLAARWSGPQR